MMAVRERKQCRTCVRIALCFLPAALSLAAIILVSCSGGSDDEHPSPQTMSRTAQDAPLSPASSGDTWRTGGYTDDADCTACHRQIAQSFTTVAMSRTLMPADTAPQIEDLDAVFHHEPSRNYYQMQRRADGRYVLRRWQQAADGTPINILEQEIDYLIGSGNHVRVYTYRTPAHELYQMPLIWLSQKRQWGMAPGFERPDHFDFTRAVQRDCIFCHNPDPGFGETGDRYGQPYVYPHEFAVGIGCQRCHGPGARHVELAYDQDTSLERVRASIVNPAGLSPRLSDDVCLQCHLQPTSERTSILRRLDHGDFSFRPGEALRDHIVHIDYRAPDARAARFEANHHGYRMMQSPCYLGSVDREAPMQCITCHDPHHTVREPLAAKQAHYRNACLTCHADDSCTVSDDTFAAHPHIAESDCITCHMPQRPPGDAPHVLLTDHRVGIYAIGDAALAASFPAGAPDHRVMSVYGTGGESVLSTEDRIYLALAGLKSGHGYDVQEFSALVDDLAADSLDARLYLADMQRDSGAWAKAEAAYRGILAEHADLAYAHHGLAFVLLQQGKTAEAIRAVSAALALNPNSPDARELFGTALMKAGKTSDAIEEYLEAVRLRPLFATAHYNLAAAYAAAGDLTSAERHFARVTEIDPRRTAAYARQGELLRARGDVAAAVRIWRHGHGMIPKDADLVRLLAETLLLAPRPEDRDAAAGLEFAEHWCDLAGGDESALALRAFAWFANGRTEEAAAGARELQARNSGGAGAIDAMLLLAVVESAQGNAAAGRRLYQQAMLQLTEQSGAPAGAAPATPLRSALLSLARRAFGQ